MKFWTMVVVAWLILQSTVYAINRYEWDLESRHGESYSKFLNDIRNDVTDPELEYGETNIPVMWKKPNPEFLRVDLRQSKGTVSIAIRRKDLYVLGYLAMNDSDIFRAYYFENKITREQLDDLFSEAQGAQNHQQIEYGDSYPQLEKNAMINRTDIGLGVKKFAAHMAQVNRMPHANTNEAKFILLAAEMVAEATRFKYIEDLILEHFPNDIEKAPDRVIILENSWRRISEATKISDKGKFKIELNLTSYALKGEVWTVHNVDELKMGIFLNVDRLSLWLILGLTSVLLLISIAIYHGVVTKAMSNGFKKA